MKKAQGLSVTTIVIAAIALVVLVVLIAVFTGRMGIWGQNLDQAQKTQACESGFKVNNKEVPSVNGNWKSACDTESEKAVYGNYADAKTGLLCCIQNPT